MLVSAVLPLALGAVDSDLVTSLPGFPATWPFKAYSGFLNVTFDPAINGYDGAHIHYQFHTSQRNASDPVVAWHTGGPGGSSIYGQYAEAGYFQVSTSAGETVNDKAWNNVANMLYLEAPAGSFLTPVDEHSGFSYCIKGGVRQAKCAWNDVTQAQAYGHTLKAFFAAYPELASNDLYLAGESYAGQCECTAAPLLLRKQLLCCAAAAPLHHTCTCTFPPRKHPANAHTQPPLPRCPRERHPEHRAPLGGERAGVAPQGHCCGQRLHG